MRGHAPFAAGRVTRRATFSVVEIEVARGLLLEPEPVVLGRLLEEVGRLLEDVVVGTGCRIVRWWLRPRGTRRGGRLVGAGLVVNRGWRVAQRIVEDRRPGAVRVIIAVRRRLDRGL